MRLLRLYVVAEQVVLVAEVELAAEDDRIRPHLPLLSGLAGLLQATLLLVGVRRRLHQRDRAALLSPDVEHAVGGRDLALADAAVRPRGLPRLDVQALQLAF